MDEKGSPGLGAAGWWWQRAPRAAGLFQFSHSLAVPEPRGAGRRGERETAAGHELSEEGPVVSGGGQEEGVLPFPHSGASFLCCGLPHSQPAPPCCHSVGDATISHSLAAWALEGVVFWKPL